MSTSVKAAGNPLLKLEAENYTTGYSGDNWNQTGYYAEVNDGPIDISISYNDGETIRYRAIHTNGDWASYSFNLETEGAYLFVLNGIGAGEFYLDGIDSPIPFKCADDGCGVIANILLAAGEHTIKIAVPKYLDMDYIGIYAGDSDYMTTEDVAAYVPPVPAKIDKSAVQLDIYVAADGSDLGDGTKEAPFRTLGRAKEEVRLHNGDMTGNIIVHFAPGYYQLDEVEKFDERDGGTNGYSVVYRGDGDAASAILSGGTRITGWERTELQGGKIWKAPADIEDTRNLWINGYPAQRAVGNYRYMYAANLEPEEARHAALDNRAEQPADARSYGIKVPKQDIFLALEHPEDVELVWRFTFTQQRTPVKDIYVDPEDPDLVVFEMDMPYWEWANTKEGNFTNPVKWDRYPDVINYEASFYLENALVLLDEPGEFYFDKTAKVVYYYPYEEEDLSTADTYVATTEFMISICGTGATGRVENITFDNLSFRYGAWNEPNTTGVQILQTDHIVSHRDNETPRGGKPLPGQMTLNFTRNINIYNCEFRSLGSSALVMDNGVADTEVIGNKFMDIAGSGIMIDSYEHVGVLPEGRVRCDNILVADNVIHRPAYQYCGMVGIAMYMPSNTVLRNNDVKDTPYSGIVAGWGWRHAAAVASANDKIINNKIEDAMSVMEDGGHIYTLDRVHNLEIAGNYCVKATDWRGGIYLDVGSRSYDIHDNVIADTYHWFFGGPGLKIEDIELFDNYYDAESVAQIDPVNVTDRNNMAVERGADGIPKWPEKALDIIAKAGLEEDYRHLLEGTELPQWRKNVIDMMPTELIRVQAKKASDEPGVTVIRGENYLQAVGTERYIKNEGEALRFKSDVIGYAIWSLGVDSDDTYAFTTVGTGLILTDEGYTGIKGRLYINNELKFETVLNTNERYNPWDNPLKTVFGAVDLAAGTYTIRLEVEGGSYVLDKILIKQSAAE